MEMILKANCSAASCHGTATMPPGDTGSGLDLFSPGVEGRAYNQPADYKNVKNPEACPTTPELLINPAGLDSSLMWMKITKTHACGDDMPQLVTFDETETACYKAWLESIIANPPTP